MTTAERETGLETALLYHEETKHHLHRYARSLGYLAWEDQPNPFREFQGASRTGQQPRRQESKKLVTLAGLRSWPDLLCRLRRPSRLGCLRVGRWREAGLEQAADSMR